jgi:hypothetical protein
MRPLRRLLETVRGWMTLADRIDETTLALKAAVDELERANRTVRGDDHA